MMNVHFSFIMDGVFHEPSLPTIINEIIHHHSLFIYHCSLLDKFAYYDVPFLCHNAKIPNLLTLYCLLSLIGEEICKKRFISIIYIVIGISY